MRTPPTAADYARRSLASAREQVAIVLRLGEDQTWAGRGRARLERQAVDQLRTALQFALMADDLDLRSQVRLELARLGRDGRGHKRMRVEPGQGIA